MNKLLVEGGLTFTVPLTILFIAVLVTGIWSAVSVRKDGEDVAFWRRMLFHLGLFSFVLGIYSQGIGLYQAMKAIEAAGDVSPALLMGGLKVSMIAPLFGLTIFLVAMLLRFGLDVASREMAPSRT